MARKRTLIPSRTVPVKKTGTASTSGGKVRPPEGMSGLAKGLAIIEAFGPRGAPLTAADAARASGTTRAAARRCLLTLVELGYLDCDGKFYRPRPRMLRLGACYLDTIPLPQIAQPILAAARDELGESVSLAILDNGWSVFIARAEALRIVSTGVRVGARLPAYCSATGRVLLGAVAEPALHAYLGEAEFEARTHKTLTDPGAILRAIEMARVENFAISDEELELGMLSMAVPVRDSRGATVAAMSISASSARISVKNMTQEFLPVLRRYADALGRAL